MNLGYISRSGGRSATANSAYISCSMLEEGRTGLVFDYSKKQGLLYQGILAPDDCPEWVYDRQTLWNAVEDFEDHIAQTRFRGHSDPDKNEKSLKGKERYLGSCKTAFTANFALPLEIEDQNHMIELSQRIVTECYVKNGLVAEYAIHLDQGNPHLHILSSTRPWTHGNFSERRFVIEKDQLIEIRHRAAEVANEFAREKGYNYILDARSYEDQGLKIIPTRHLGPKAYHKHKDNSHIVHENNGIHQENLLILFNHPEEIIKLVATKKVVFTQEDIEREIFKRVGGDMHLSSLLKARLEGIEILPVMFKVANDPTDLRGEAFKADLNQTISSYAQQMLHNESIIDLERNLKDEAVYTTKKALELEENARGSVQNLCSSQGKSIPSTLKERAIKRAEQENGFSFSNEQKGAIDHLLEPTALRVLKGNAGTGKTTVLKPVVEAYKEAGYIPLGTAFQGKVSELLSYDLGIQAYTLDQLQKRWMRYDKLKGSLQTLKGKALQAARRELEKLTPYQLTERHIIILDEGNMVGGHHWQELLTRVQEAGAHLRVVQDNSQIKALFGADISRLIEKEAGHFELTEVHRQKEAWMREASNRLNTHDVRGGLEPYYERGCLNFKASIESTRYALAESYINNLETSSDEFHVALAFRNRDVEDLNDAIRHQLKQRGSLGESITFQGHEFSVGDRIVFTENDHTGWFIKTLDSQGFQFEERRGVKNGTFGQIESLDEKKSCLNVRLLKDGRLVQVNLKTYGHIEYGYAMTVNKAEGQTFDRVYGLFDSLMNANLTLIWMTRHRLSFQGFISEDHAVDVKGMADAVGRSDYRPLISDFSESESSEADLMRRYLAASIEANNLWGVISKENIEAPYEHADWVDFQGAQQVRNQLAEGILERWDYCRTFANQVGVKKVVLEVQAGLKERHLSDVEVEALQRVEAYRSVTNRARILQNTISKSKFPSKTHPLSREYKELAELRNQIAYEIVSFPQLHSPFFKTTQKEGSYVTYGGEVYEAYPPTLRTAQKHSQSYMKAQQQKAFAQRLSSAEKFAFEELHMFKEHVFECGRLVSTFQNKCHFGSKEKTALKFALEETAKERDFFAYKIVTSFDKYSHLIERADVSQDQLLKYAVFGEVRQLALKHKLARTVERRLEISEQLFHMVGEGDKLDKSLLGFLKGYDIELSRLRFEQGCLKVMKEDGHLPFKEVVELASAFASLNDYRKVHQEAAHHWNIIKTHAAQKVISLQDEQIASINTWRTEQPQENSAETEIKSLSREDIEKLMSSENLSKHKGRKISQKPQKPVTPSLNAPANTETLSFVTKELIRVVNGSVSHSTPLPQEIQLRQAELLHLQSHLRNGHSGYYSLYKADRAEDQRWENLRERKLMLASQVLEKYGNILKASFDHDYKRMEKEAYEHQIGQLVSRFDKARGETKAALAGEILSHLGCEEYRGICTKTQLKKKDVNFEALHLYGLFHETSSHLPEKDEILKALESYIQTQEVFSSLWKPRCDVIETGLEPLKREFALYREQVLASLEDVNCGRPCTFILDRLTKETQAFILKNKANETPDILEQRKPHQTESNSETQQALKEKVQERIQHLGESLEWGIKPETLEHFSQEVIHLSQKQNHIHEKRIALMKKTTFENDKEFFECARERNKAAHDLMQTPLGRAIEDSRYASAVKAYAERYHDKLEKDPTPWEYSDRINHNFSSQTAYLFLDHKVVVEALRQNVATFADEIFSSAGEPFNRSASSSYDRRYGKKGHISVNLRTGQWINYKDSSLSGGPLQMLTKLKGLTFKHALEYGASWAGITPERRELKDLEGLSTSYQEIEKERVLKQEEEHKAKIAKANALWAKGQPIQGTIAERYLKEHRKIEGDLPQDLRFLPSLKTKNSNISYPCLITASRSPAGEITAIQLTYLDPITAAKANILMAKRSFGVLKGSAVTLQEGKDLEPIFVAEGIETALSLKEAGAKGTILATLGLSSIQRLEPKNKKTPVIICADHDAPDSQATKTLNKSVIALQERGLNVTVIRPDKLKEDFNDVLIKHGPQGVREILQRHLPQEFMRETKVIEMEALKVGDPEDPSSKNGQNKHQKHTHQTIEVKGKSFEEIQAQCEQRLIQLLESEKRFLTPELKSRISTQAERTANFLVHKGINQTPEEVRELSLRAKYELERLPEIRKELLEEWKDNGTLEARDGLLAHMMAERLVSVEGRYYLAAIKSEEPIPLDIEERARKELEQHQKETRSLAKELYEKYSLSEKAALCCAKDIVRYKETHGENPTADQMSKMAKIAKILEDRDYGNISKGVNQHEMNFLYRREGDLLFRHALSHEKLQDSLDLSYVQRQAKNSLEALNQQIAKEFSRVIHKELSL